MEIFLVLHQPTGIHTDDLRTTFDVGGTVTDLCKVIYLGMPLGALALLHDGLDVPVVCVPRVRTPGMRRLRRELAKRGGLLLGRPSLDQPEVQTLLQSVQPTLIASWFWTKKIPEKVLTIAPHAFGVHPSLLPKYRGPDPYFWTLANGETTTGVTAHLLTHQYDEGDMIKQVSTTIPSDCDAWGLAKHLDRPSLALFREIAGKYSRGETVTSIPQNDADATSAPSPDDADCELLWTWPVGKVLCRIRAASPDPGAFTGFGDETVVILRAKQAKRTPELLVPGEIGKTEEGVVIRASDGAIVVLAARREGEDEVFADDRVLQIFPGLPRV